MPIRSFVAIPVPSAMADALGDVAARMAYQDKSNAVRWVDQENYHITLAFLGEQQEADLDQLAGCLDEHISSNNVSISLKHCSPFPEGKPKLIAAMVEGNDGLRELHQQTRAAINATSIVIDKRRFIPHITVGRYRHSKNHFVGAIPTSLELAAEIIELGIFESTLTSRAAEYQALYRFPFEDYEYALDEI